MVYFAEACAATTPAPVDTLLYPHLESAKPISDKSPIMPSLEKLN